MRNHAELIRRLGGGTAVGTLLSERGHSVDREAIYKWQTNGVPWRWRPTVAEIAREVGLAAAIPDGFLDPPGEDKQESAEKPRTAA